jgi:hypothetical protein
MLPTAGGSTSLWTRRPEGLIPVFAEADYEVSAFVRTTELKAARAFIIARLLDQAGRPIDGAWRRSEPAHSPSAWTPVKVQLPSADPRAAFLQVELQLLQPEQFMPKPLAPEHHVWSQDLSGAAWFDDIAVTQLARVSLAPAREGSVIVAPSRPAVEGVVRDLTGELLTARLVVRDVDGVVRETADRPLGVGGGKFSFTPNLPALGWYRVEMTVLAGENPVGAADTQLLWLPPAPASRPGPGEETDLSANLALLTTSVPRGLDVQIAQLLDAARTPAVVAPMVISSTDVPDQPRSQAPALALIDRLLTDRRAVSIAVARVDAAIAGQERIDAGDSLAAILKDDRVWKPSLLPVLDLYGQRVSRWHLGVDANLATAHERDLLPSLARFRQALASLVPSPRVTIPWRADAAPPPPPRDGGPDGVAVALPPELASAQVEQTVTAWRGWALAQKVDLAFVIESPADADPRAAVASLMIRTVAAKAAMDRDQMGAPSKLMIDQPWGESPTGALLPRPTLAAWRTFIDLAGPRRVVGIAPSPPGVHCLVLGDGPGSSTRRPGVLAVWCDPGVQSGEISAYLGSGRVRRVDAFGNAAPLTPSDESGMYTIPAGPTMSFVEGIEPELVLFVTGLRINPRFAPAVAAEHEHELIVSNPWGVPISGTIQILAPRAPGGGKRRPWRFAPTTPLPFTVPPGEQRALPFSFSFPATEDAGDKVLEAVVNLTAERAYPVLRAGVVVSIGSGTLLLTQTAERVPDASGADVLVTATVTNSGKDARSLRLIATAPGQEPQSRAVSNLAPGQVAVQRFLFKQAGAALSGKRVRIALTDADGPERLNQSAQVP